MTDWSTPARPLEPDPAGPRRSSACRRPQAALRGAAHYLDSFLAALSAEHSLATTLGDKLAKPDALDEATRSELLAAATVRIDSVVYPAFRRVAARVAELMPESGRFGQGRLAVEAQFCRPSGPRRHPAMRPHRVDVPVTGQSELAPFLSVNVSARSSRSRCRHGHRHGR